MNKASVQHTTRSKKKHGALCIEYSIQTLVNFCRREEKTDWMFTLVPCHFAQSMNMVDSLKYLFYMVVP